MNEKIRIVQTIDTVSDLLEQIMQFAEKEAAHAVIDTNHVQEFVIYLETVKTDILAAR
jgi:hypothetical protein